LVATDFFTVEVLTLTGLITYFVLFFIDLESRRTCVAGVTRHPDQAIVRSGHIAGEHCGVYIEVPARNQDGNPSPTIVARSLVAFMATIGRKLMSKKAAEHPGSISRR
jgi:hypothetical protein